MPTIVEFADLKLALDLTKAAVTDYPYLAVLSDKVHADLERHTGRTLSPVGKATEVGYLEKAEININLKNIPVKSVTSVIIDDVTLTSDEYVVTNYGIRLISQRSGAYTIVTKGGHKTIPEDIYRAELSQIVYEWQNKNNLAVKNFTNDGGSTSLPGFVILQHVKEMLSAYVHIDKLGY